MVPQTFISCMKTLLFTLFAFAAISVQAQKAPIKFGEIPIDDLKMTTYDKDSSAEAVILADYGVSSLVFNQNEGFTLLFERITRIKILTKDGLDWATFSVPLYHESSNDEKMTGLRAVTYNLESSGMVESKMKNDAVFKEKVNENLDLMKFTLPNAKQGSIVEVTYKVTSDFLFNFQDWEFQSTIPTRWSEYRAHIPEFYNYDKYTQGYVAMTISESEQKSDNIVITSTERSGSYTTSTDFNRDQVDFMENRFRWAVKDAPAFKEEPFITTRKDYISKINFELAYYKFPNQPIKPVMGTWEDINRQFDESDNFGREISGNGFLKKITEEVIAGKTTPEEKISAINHFVKNNVEWDGRSFRYTDTSFKKVLEDKKGSSSEINLLMASMLEKAGIQVEGVLISTRDHGFIRQSVPISSQFNYVICMAHVGAKQILLDATDRFLPTGVLPERCLNGSGFVVSKKGFSWVPLKPSLKSRNVYQADLTLNQEGELKGKLQMDRSGYFAQSGRKRYVSKGESDYLKDLIGSRPWTIGKSEFTNVKEVSEPFKEAHEIVITDHVVSTDALFYINPFVVMQENENPFKSESRQYPVDFGSPVEKIYMCRITIPEGYTVDELPKPVVLKLPENSARFTYSITQLGNILSVTSNLQINNSLFTQEEYPNLREFYNMVVAKHAEQVVLKKKS